jgi:hypothetical protein
MDEQPFAYRFLERLQEQVYTQLNRQDVLSSDKRLLIETDVVERFMEANKDFVSNEEEEKMRANITKGVEELKNLKLPTRYEDLERFKLMVDLQADIEQAAKDFSLSTPQKPLIGTLPTGQVNAMAVAVPGTNDYLVLFETELFNFVLLISKVVARALPLQFDEKENYKFSTDMQDIQACIEQTPEILRHFQELVHAYLFLGQPGKAPPYILEGPYSYLSWTMMHSLELFVMGHEYGHIIAGHVNEKRMFSDLLDIEVEEIVRNWKDELEADRMGLQLMLQAMQRDRLDLSLSFWGVELFFSCEEILDRGRSIILTGAPDRQEIGSHPPPELRREQLRRTLTASVPQLAAQGPLQLGQVVMQVIELLWQKTEPYFYQARKEKKELARIWH